MRVLRRFGWLMAALALGVVAWAALAPIAVDVRDELFEIPSGTWARRMAGNKIEILPDRIRLTLGANDVLLLRNLDDVPQIFGPTLIMPGQSFRLPFEVASTYKLCLHRACQRADEHHRRPQPRAGLGDLALACEKFDKGVGVANRRLTGLPARKLAW